MDNFNKAPNSILSTPAAILIIIVFFLPWMTVSCGFDLIEFTGYELASGQDPALQGMADPSVPTTFPDFWLIPVAAIMTLVAVFAVPGSARIIYIIAGVLGSLVMGYRYLNFQSQVTQAKREGFDIYFNYQPGWILTVVALITIIVAGFISLPRKR